MGGHGRVKSFMLTVNNNSKTVLSLFNVISLQINTTFPVFHKSPEASGTEIFVSGGEELQDMLLIVLKFKSSLKSVFQMNENHSELSLGCMEDVAVILTPS